jgi:hypothetical protein
LRRAANVASPVGAALIAWVVTVRLFVVGTNPETGVTITRCEI